MSCQEPVDEKIDTSWSILYKQVLQPNCSNCHMNGSAIQKQSGLDFSSSAVYNDLVGVVPKNLAATEDGLLRVSTEGGMKGLTQSYLWEKINIYDQEHFLNDHPEYGQLMPPGGNVLTDGELQFVRSWIEAGAPATGIVVDEDVLLNTDRYIPEAFTKLDPPTNGIQLHLGPFDVQPNYEREFFQFTALDQNSDMYVNRIEIEMRRGSHHFLLYTFNENTPQQILPSYDQPRELRNENSIINLSTLYQMQFHKFFGGTQWSRLDYRLPDGVALKIPQGSGLDQNSHYVNRTDSVMTGEVYTNLHTINKEDVAYVAELFDFNNTDIYLPPKKVTTLTKTFILDEKYYMGQVFSHAHEKMQEFVVEIVGGQRNGEVIYWTNDWEHPPIINFDPPIEINAGEGLKLIATYNNPTNDPVTFGYRSVDEMMILFGWYYK
tara:strand:- start:4729 stop:6030 length:1302 start_codon:yes stop_codon:yes gene_type:complete